MPFENNVTPMTFDVYEIENKQWKLKVCLLEDATFMVHNHTGKVYRKNQWRRIYQHDSDFRFYRDQPEHSGTRDGLKFLKQYPAIVVDFNNIVW
jgi:hypothetical protein